MLVTTSHSLAFPNIRGAEIIAQAKVELTPNKPLDFHWKGHGFKIHIPAGAISEERGPVTLCIQASLSGEYQLPDDGVLVSGVYWLSLHPHVERFDRKVTLSLQHCASVTDDSALSFVTTKCTQKQLPYTFEALSGGIFSLKSSAIQVTSFSGFSIRDIFSAKQYTFSVFYTRKKLNEYEVHITVTRDLKLIRKVICYEKIHS